MIIRPGRQLALALLVQVALYRRVVRLQAPSATLGRLVGGAYLLLWFGVGLCGRAIGYV